LYPEINIQISESIAKFRNNEVAGRQSKIAITNQWIQRLKTWAMSSEGEIQRTWCMVMRL